MSHIPTSAELSSTPTDQRTAPTEVILTESRTMRAQTADRVDVLDKVKALAMLPDGMHATTDIVASYYEVGIEAIKSLIKDNRAELEENGYRVLTGAERTEFVRSQQDLTLPPARHLAIFTRRAILNVGQLLTESDVARQVRTYLLDVEETATPEQKATAINPRAVQQPDDDLDVIEGMVRAIRADRQRLAAVEQAQAATAAKVAAIEGHYDEYTALAYAKLHDYPTGRPYLAKVGKHATALMREQGAEPHRRQDATFGAINVYPVSVLELAFAEMTR